jgi:hypothetical protein
MIVLVPDKELSDRRQPVDLGFPEEDRKKASYLRVAELKRC